MNRKIFAWIMVVMMVMTMMPVPAVQSHAHAETECAHDWQYGRTYCTCKKGCGTRCLDIANEVNVQESIKKWNGTQFQIVKNSPCGSHTKNIGPVATVKVEKSATCTEPAKTVYTAKDYPEVVWTVTNGTVADHEYEDGVCIYCEAPCTHTGGAATCTKAAVCANCGASYGEAAGHKGGEATCDFPAKCEVCGQSYGDPKGHTWADGACTVCGETCFEHQGGTATCEKLPECTECGKSYGQLLDHNWEEGKCTECDTAHEDHIGGAATCTAKAVCEICGFAYGDTLPHVWVEGVCQNGCDTIHNHTAYELDEEATELIEDNTKFELAFVCADCGVKVATDIKVEATAEVTQNADCVKPEQTTYSASGECAYGEYEIEKTVETAPNLGKHEDNFVIDVAESIKKTATTFNIDAPKFTVYKVCACGARSTTTTIYGNDLLETNKVEACDMPLQITFVVAGNPELAYTYKAKEVLGHTSGEDGKCIRCGEGCAKHNLVVIAEKTKLVEDGKMLSSDLVCDACGFVKNDVVLPVEKSVVIQQATCTQPEKTKFSTHGESTALLL